MTIQIAEQFKPLIHPKRYKVYYGGRGGSKSWGYAQILLLKGAEKKLRILCTREYQGSIRESVHKLLSDTIIRLGLSSFYRVERQAIYGINGTHFIFEGLQNVTKIKSLEGVSICWVEEAEAVVEHSWDVIIPTIREKGSEIWVSFNPMNDDDATYKRFIEPYQEILDRDGIYTDDTIHVQKIGWRENKWFPEELRREMEMLKEKDHAKYLHVYEGETKAAVEGAIYGEQLRKAVDDKRIGRVPVESSLLVHTAWDIGLNDTTAIVWFQASGAEIRIIDCYEGRLQGLDHYAKVLKDKGYLYGSHYLPHDIQVTELSTNTTRLEVLEQLGVRPVEVVPRVRQINEGIEQTRQMFSRCWFDKEGAADLLKALRKYQYVWDEKYGVFRSKPLHNAASNYADAFRQIAQGFDVSDNWGYNKSTFDPSRFEARAPR